MQKENTQQAARPNYLKKIARITLKVVVFLILFVVTLFLLLLTPPVQKFAVSKVEGYLQNKLKTEVRIGGVSIGLPRKVVLKDIYLEDRTKDTLLYGGSVKANIELMKLVSGEINIKSIELDNITTKIKRVLPDTAFNFQFIVDAFAPQTPTVDTTTAEVKMDIDNVALNNCRVIYKDAITGNDMALQVGSLDANIDTFNVNIPHYDIGTLDVRNVVAVLNQSKPLATPEPVAKDMADAAEPIAMKLGFDRVNLEDINVQYNNDVSAFYTKFNIDQLLLDGKNLDLQNRLVHFDKLKLQNAVSAIRLGKTEAARVVAKEVKQEVEAQEQNNWIVRVNDIQIDNNSFAFDNDNTPKQPYGIDYAHMKADSLTLHAQNFVMNTDSIGVLITEGRFREQSGFVLSGLKGDLLYANNQAYLKDLYLKTPGTLLQRNVVLEYASYDALINEFAKTKMDVDIDQSYIQVKDILAFAPQLRTQPAFRNKNAVWRLNLQGNGTMDNLEIEALQFRGLGNTQLDASGTLTSLTNPNAAGGGLTIRKFHTTQNDIALFTGSRLSTPDLNLPESFDIDGKVNGNAQNLTTALNLRTTAGFIALTGRFTNLTAPAKATYNATVKTTGLRLGSILKNEQVGTVTATVTAVGTGFTPDAINTRFNGHVTAAGFNNYTYRNIDIKGSLRKTVFNVTTTSHDPNAALMATVSGNFSKTLSFKIDAMVDSLKALPLNFTTEPLTFRGKIDGDFASIDPANLQGNLLITKGLLVSGTDRLPLDTLQLIANKDNRGQYLRLNSPLANALIEGQFSYADLGTIFQSNINPYFTIATGKLPQVTNPYDVRFTVDVANSPFIAKLVPGFVVTEPLHIEGSLATNRGLQGSITSKQLTFSGNALQALDVQITTTPQGLQLSGNIAQLKGAGFNLYNTRINATALNNNINFSVGIDDKNAKNKYFLAGLFTQPSSGTYALQLRPDSLLLNYELWNVAANNRLVIAPTYINADNFVLQKGVQQLALQSAGIGANQPLNITFANFRLGTLTGFVQPDTLLADGLMNGTVTFKNLPEQPLFTSDLTINDLSMQSDTLGNLRLQVSNTTLDRYDANISLSGRGNDAQITGAITQLGKEMGLDLNVNLRQLRLNTLQGAMAGFVNSASGSISANIDINGTTTQPRIVGSINFDTATVHTIFLGGPLMIDKETISITENGFRFDNFSVLDSARNALTINGDVRTTNFINYNFGLDVNATNFRALNTTRKDNDIYFGKLNLSSNLHVGGTEKKPIVDGSIVINEGTDLTIVIPQAQPGVVQREGVVEFVDFNTPENDTLFLARYDSLNISDIVGFDISANIDISKEANFNVIIDVANGDLLNLRGTGQLSTGIDPSGKITLTGTYEVEEGGYQFSMNFLKRRFVLQKGSKITWLGDPTDAQLDMTALYVANTAPLDLVENRISEEVATIRNQYLQKLPFQVLLNLDGELMKPVLTFDIQLPTDGNYNVGGDIVSNVNTRLTELRQEPSELNKQVFSILLLNRFVGENPFASGAGGGFNAGSFARQSVSKLLTEQLNQLAGGLIGGVDLNFDVGSSDDYTTGSRRNRTDLNVGLSKRLLNDRLTVTVGSNFQLEGPQAANQPSNNIAGNVAINYQLSKDGRYMLRFYRRNEYEGVVDGYIIETGMGFILTVDYNRFKHIFESGKKKAERLENYKKQQQH